MNEKANMWAMVVTDVEFRLHGPHPVTGEEMTIGPFPLNADPDAVQAACREAGLDPVTCYFAATPRPQEVSIEAEFEGSH